MVKRVPNPFGVDVSDFSRPCPFGPISSYYRPDKPRKRRKKKAVKPRVRKKPEKVKVGRSLLKEVSDADQQ